MPYADPAIQIVYQKNRAKARQRALRRLARIHWEEFDQILAEELEKVPNPARSDGQADG